MLRFNSSQPVLRDTQGSLPVLAGHIDNVLVTPSFHRTAGFPEERDFLGSYKPQQTKEELGSRGVTGGPTGEPLADIKAIPNAHLAKQHTFPNPAPPHPCQCRNANLLLCLVSRAVRTETRTCECYSQPRGRSGLCGHQMLARPVSRVFAEGRGQPRSQYVE